MAPLSWSYLLSLHLLGLLALLYFLRLRSVLLFLKPRFRATQRRKMFWRSSFQWHTPMEFSRRFRVSKVTFLKMLRCLHPKLKSKRYFSSPSLYFMPTEVKLAVTLRYLAGGEMYDVADNFGYNHSTGY